MTPAPKHSPPSPKVNALALAVAAALLGVPSLAAAQNADDVKVTLKADDGSGTSFAVIGQANCAERIRTRVKLEGTIDNYPSDANTEKYLYVAPKGITCKKDDVVAACNAQAGSAAATSCRCLKSAASGTTKSDFSTTQPLYVLLPGGEDTCSAGTEEHLEFHLLMVNPDAADSTADAGTTEASDAVATTKVDATSSADAKVQAAASADSDPPFRMEIDLDPPAAPDGDFSVVSGDKSLVVTFPDIESEEISEYRLCATSDANFSPGGGSGSAADGGVGSATGSVGNCKSVTGSGDESIEDVKVNVRYYIWVAAVDNADNVGPYRMVGTGVPVEYLDFADYYRAMHGNETGGCAVRPGTAPWALGGATLLAFAGLRRRSRRTR